MLTIGGILVAGGGYVISLKTRVVVLETQVVPVLQGADRLIKLEAHDADHERRIGRIEGNLDLDYNETVKAARAKKR